jgi:hypothetical protein
MLDSLGGWNEPSPESPAYDISPRHFGGRLRYAETVLPIDHEVYVLGQVGAENQIVQPAGCDRPYLITHRTEESLLNRARWGKRIYGALVAVLFVGGMVVLGIGSQGGP